MGGHAATTGLVEVVGMWTPKISRERIAQNALDCVGLPVSYPRTLGVPDCLDIVAYIYEYEALEQDRESFPDDSLHLLHTKLKSVLGWHERTQEGPQPGDLLLFDIDTGKKHLLHVGVFVGNDKFIHAGQKEVVCATLSRWGKYIKGVLTW